LGANLTTLVALQGNYCIFQAALKQFFATAAVLWPLVIALTLYCAVVLRGVQGFFSWEDGSGIMFSILESPAKYHSLVWGFSLFAALIPLATNSYGQAGLWCWIKENEEDSSTVNFVFFYGVVWCSFIASSISYFSIHRVLRGIVLEGASDVSCEHSNFTPQSFWCLGCLQLYTVLTNISSTLK
jgi:hypothetical protein